MLRRGSAQLLLLFFRSRARLGWTIGAIAGVLIVACMLRAGDDFPLLTRTGIAQALHQSAWQHALAGLPEPAPWPWAETSSGTAAAVPQLGLSASVVKERSPGKDDGGDSEDPHVPRTKLSEVGVGDRITVTTADGSSRVYRITGSRVVNPHLAQTEPGPSGDEPTLVTCLPLDPLLANSLRLIIQATKVDPPALPDPRPEQKL
jgi:sortase A